MTKKNLLVNMADILDVSASCADYGVPGNLGVGACSDYEQVAAEMQQNADPELIELWEVVRSFCSGTPWSVNDFAVAASWSEKARKLAEAA